MGCAVSTPGAAGDGPPAPSVAPSAQDEAPEARPEQVESISAAAGALQDGVGLLPTFTKPPLPGGPGPPAPAGIPSWPGSAGLGLGLALRSDARSASLPTWTGGFDRKQVFAKKMLSMDRRGRSGASGALARKERRLGHGTEGVRDRIKKMAIGGGSGGPDGPDFYAVSSSEGEASDDGSAAAPTAAYDGPGQVVFEADPREHTDEIASALERSFVFKGIDQKRLHEVVRAMLLVRVAAGTTVISQGAPPGEADCMYLVASGEVDIVIAGGGEQRARNEDHLVEGNLVRIHKRPGWLFGDVALLFNSQRSASVIATTDATLWALSRRAFLRFVLHHAPGACMLRFVRKLPLLKGVSDNALLEVAARMAEESYEDGQTLIRMGEQGARLFLIRRGRVAVMRPAEQPDAPPSTLAVLGRGHFVGERTLVTGKLRTADCVAVGRVEAVVMSKRDFQDLDNPLLAWMIDYDAVATVLKGTQTFGGLLADDLEGVADCFERTEHPRGAELLRYGQPCPHVAILRAGELAVEAPGEPLPEIGGFAYYGEYCFRTDSPSSRTVTVASESAVLLTAPHAAIREALAKLMPLGSPAQDPAAVAAVVPSLARCQALSGLEQQQLGQLAAAMTHRLCSAGDVIAPAGAPDDALLFIARGAALSTQDVLTFLPGSGGRVALMGLTGEALSAGMVESQQALLIVGPRTTFLVAQRDRTQVFALTRRDAEAALGGPLPPVTSRAGSKPLPRDLETIRDGAADVAFEDLELGRIAGVGQFGLVRIAQHRTTGQVFALKIMHKAPLTEVKEVEHVVNERRILGLAGHPFCVRLLRAFQDARELYLLQEWVGGGELFRQLDIEGAFCDGTARFYAANVLLALQHLHSLGVVYRDLKPENLLLGADGYVKVADFGFAKLIGSGRTYTICGTPDYQAPEIILRKGTGVAADFWALGVLIFEMLVGDPPFKSLSGDPWDTFRRTLSGRFFVPATVPPPAADLICKLLQVNPEKRLGSGPAGAAEIQSHAWFAGLDWAALAARRLPAPFVPALSHPLDTSNFDSYEEDEVPPAASGRTDKFTDRWEGLWDWIESPPQPQQGL